MAKSTKLPYVEEILSDGQVNLNDGGPLPMRENHSNVHFVGTGTFGGGTLKLQYQPDPDGLPSVWLDVPSAILTAPGMVPISALPGRYRLDLSGATGASIEGGVLI